PVEGVDWSAPQQLTQNGLDRMALLETFPDNIVELIDVPVLIVASGAGGPQPQFVFENQQALALAQEACAATPPLLPEAICDFLFLAAYRNAPTFLTRFAGRYSSGIPACFCAAGL